MAKFGKTVLGRSLKDIVRIAARPLHQTISSITGKPMDEKFNYETKFFRAINKTQDFVINGSHIVGKIWADTISGGLIGKFANSFRNPMYREGWGGWGTGSAMFNIKGGQGIFNPKDTPENKGLKSELQTIDKTEKELKGGWLRWDILLALLLLVIGLILALKEKKK